MEIVSGTEHRGNNIAESERNQTVGKKTHRAENEKVKESGRKEVVLKKTF